MYCVIRSPFKDKDSREHFEIRTHKRLIDIHQPTPKTVDSLQRLDHLPAGVDIEIRLASQRTHGLDSRQAARNDPFTDDGRVERVTVQRAAPVRQGFTVERATATGVQPHRRLQGEVDRTRAERLGHLQEGRRLRPPPAWSSSAAKRPELLIPARP